MKDFILEIAMTNLTAEANNGNRTAWFIYHMYTALFSEPFLIILNLKGNLMFIKIYNINLYQDDIVAYYNAMVYSVHE